MKRAKCSDSRDAGISEALREAWGAAMAGCDKGRDVREEVQVLQSFGVLGVFQHVVLDRQRERILERTVRCSTFVELALSAAEEQKRLEVLFQRTCIGECPILFTREALYASAHTTAFLTLWTSFIHESILCFESSGQIKDNHMNSLVHELKWSRYMDSILTDVLYPLVQAKIDDACADEYFEPTLPEVYKWIDRVILQWLQDSTDVSTLVKWKSRLHLFTAEYYVELRNDKLFEIIRELEGSPEDGEPSTEPVLHEMKECLSITLNVDTVAKALGTTFRKRLLHPGAMTESILKIYVQSTRAASILDDTDVLDRIAIQPIREYLKQRPDTFACLTTWLYEADVSDKHVFELVESLYQDKAWKLFISNFQSTLAKRLLSSNGYSVMEHIAKLEMLKKHIGTRAMSSSELNACKIMLNDVELSERTTHIIRTETQCDIPDYFHAKILSYRFWPKSVSGTFKIPKFMYPIFEAFQQGFEEVRVPRELEWDMERGSVHLTVEMPNGHAVEITCSPIEASLIQIFSESEKSHLTISCLSSALSLEASDVSRAAKVWIRNGILRKTVEGFCLLDAMPSSTQYESDGSDDDDQNRNTANMDSEWVQDLPARIIGMVSGKGGLPLSHIHHMLHVASQRLGADYDWNELELKQFLQGLVTQEKLQLSNSLYSRPRPA